MVGSVDDGATARVESHVQSVVVEGGGQVARDRAGHDNLFSLGGQGGQARPARGVELGEDVIEDEDRGVAVVAEQLEGAQAQGEGDRGSMTQDEFIALVREKVAGEIRTPGK